MSLSMQVSMILECAKQAVLDSRIPSMERSTCYLADVQSKPSNKIIPYQDNTTNYYIYVYIYNKSKYPLRSS